MPVNLAVIACRQRADGLPMELGNRASRARSCRGPGTADRPREASASVARIAYRDDGAMMGEVQITAAQRDTLSAEALSLLSSPARLCWRE
jgi:hypothetical protein